MYKYFKGLLTHKNTDHIVVECAGVGYLINMPIRYYDDLKVGNEVLVYTYLAVRENDMELFGFLTEDDEKIFRKLISVSKIGPKTALNIISLYNSSEIIKIVNEEDVDELSKVSGIGKKGAGRIILELKGKINFKNLSDDNDSVSPGAFSETREALENLGYSREAVRKVLKKAQKEFETDANVEELLKYAITEIEEV
ncbi:MAG: Holliday junction branch migration protein RuvA [Candidatus Muiribacterium halophilum]|uniref:Holliday junction branch migration complex subunit RuvA n=1 Tax=Muiribacterium halophilum TaxID=2053465 RepID=A0A2N5ZFF3_MUIH1|nr:MAG: Holliday junction branch migration protein RuvA [Candidatus Muirbacterium halophilum]